MTRSRSAPATSTLTTGIPPRLPDDVVTSAGHRDRRHHLLEDEPLLGYVAAEIERRVSQQLVKRVALLLAHCCRFGSRVRASARRAAVRSGTSGRARSPWR